MDLLPLGLTFPTAIPLTAGPSKSRKEPVLAEPLDQAHQDLSKGVTRFYNGRGTAEQWIKEGKYALNWTRLSYHRFVANQMRLWLSILAYNLGNFLRRLALPEAVKDWSLRSVPVKPIKIGGRLVHHARRLVFQLAEVAVWRSGGSRG